jgi:hypothetical protein
VVGIDDRAVRLVDPMQVQSIGPAGSVGPGPDGYGEGRGATCGAPASSAHKPWPWPLATSPAIPTRNAKMIGRIANFPSTNHCGKELCARGAQPAVNPSSYP